MSIEKANKGTVLLVDDNVTNLQVLIDYLGKSGFKTPVARSGEGALRQLEFIRPDIILLDIMMPPGIDGFETCRRLKENDVSKDIPVIFVTALIETVDKVKGFKLGAVDYITKPFQQEEVLARITTHLTIQQQKKELSELNAKLSESNATKDKFFSIIAHDMRNGFNGLLGFSRILSESVKEFSKDEIEGFGKNMYDSAKTTFKLLENLLDWARIQRGTIKFRPRVIHLYDAVLKNIDIFKENARQKDISLTHSLESGIYAYADPDMTDTIFRNLISNAIKFTPRGGEIQISAEIFGEIAEISVSDTGIGMDQEDIQKLFKIEGGYKRSGTDDEQGTGLGLILCKELVQKNSGEIYVESEVEKGTTFKFTLPAEELSEIQK